jgi:hypothetical protein
MYKQRVINNPNRTLIVTLFTIVFVFLFFISYGQVDAQIEENLTASEPSFLFIQSAQSGSVSQINDTTYSVELNNVADKTISFSDRPYRIVETLDTSEFIGNWSSTEDSFAFDPPNVTFVVLDNNVAATREDVREEIALLELSNPVYNENANTLTYDAQTDNSTSINLPDDFGQAILIIDGTNCTWWDTHDC